MEFDLTPEDKIDMSLDDIIKIQLRKQMFAENQRKWRKTEYLNRNLYHQNKYGRPQQTRHYPLMLYTKKYRQVEAFKRLQRAKYTLLQINLRKRNEAYKRWEARTNTSEAGMSSASAELDNVSVCSNCTNMSQARRRNTSQWAAQNFSTPVHGPSNLTVQVKNRMALRSRLNRNRVSQNMNFANRRLPGLAQLQFNRTRILPRFNQATPQASRMVVPAQQAPLTLNERFSMLQEISTAY